MRSSGSWMDCDETAAAPDLVRGLVERGIGGSSSAFVVAAALRDDRGKAAQVVSQQQRQPGSIQLPRLLRHAWSGSPGVDAVVTALVLAASRCSVSAPSHDRTDPSATRSVRACGDEQVDRRPVFAALLSRLHRHRSDRVVAAGSCGSTSVAESAALATEQKSAQPDRLLLLDHSDSVHARLRTTFSEHRGHRRAAPGLRDRGDLEAVALIERDGPGVWGLEVRGQMVRVDPGQTSAQ